MSSSLRPCCPDLSVFASLAISCSVLSPLFHVLICVYVCFWVCWFLCSSRTQWNFPTFPLHTPAGNHKPTCDDPIKSHYSRVADQIVEWLHHSLWWLRFLLLRVMKLSCTEEIAGICGSEVNVLSNCKYQVSWSAAQHLEGELLAPGIRTHHYCGFTFLETVVITYQCKLNSLFWRSCAFESYFILQQTDTNNSV